jgi:hypothetical protein
MIEAEFYGGVSRRQLELFVVLYLISIQRRRGHRAHDLHRTMTSPYNDFNMFLSLKATTSMVNTYFLSFYL